MNKNDEALSPQGARVKTPEKELVVPTIDDVKSVKDEVTRLTKEQNPPEKEKVVTAPASKQEPAEKAEEPKYDTFDNLPPLTSFRNMHPHMTIVWNIHGDEEEKADTVIRPGDEVLLNEKDRRHYRTDVNLLNGNMVPDTPERAASVTNKGQNIMTEMQIHYLVLNSENADDLSEKIEDITAVNTLRRVREECGVGKQDKPMSYTEMIDRHIIARHEATGGKVTAHDKQGHMVVEKEGGLGKNT